MKRICICCVFIILAIQHMNAQLPDSAYVYNDPGYHSKKHPWWSAVGVFGINAAVWGFDRYVMQEDFAKISFKTIKNNFKTGFVWDNDQFSTNLFAHPYHGSLYYNMARSNGLSFWESAPYTFAGSFMWEFFAENEPAAINDFLATSIGGIALGEMTYRLSSLVLDDSKRGFHRVWREALGMVASPMRGLNRIISGDMWKVKHSYYKYHNFDRIPVKFAMDIGIRYLADDNYFFKGDNSPYVKLNMIYGDAFSKDNTSPFDYFTLNALFNLSGGQPIIGEVNLIAKLWGKQLPTKTGMEMMAGVFQHFNYFDSQEVIDGTGNIPYRISEAASFGPGVIYKFPTINQYINLEQHIYANAILLGGSLTDYYRVIDRDYNMGSGFSIKNQTNLNFGQYGSFALNLYHYRIFTWKGYENKDPEEIEENPLYVNAQGDKGNTRLTVINPVIDINLTNKFKICAEASYYIRNTHYTYHENVDFRTFETRLGLSYQF